MSLQDEAGRAALQQDLKTSFLVEASAGTGKTQALIDRTVALLGSGNADVTRLVVITFSERAAGELKLRLRGALDEARAEAKDPIRSHLEAAVARLEDAVIDTIHGFCRTLLKLRPVEAGLDPAFKVDGDGRALLRDVFRSWFERQLGDPKPGLRRYLARGRVLSPDETPASQLERAVAVLLDNRDLAAPWPTPDGDLAEDAAELRRSIEGLRGTLEEGEPSDPLRVACSPLLDFAEWSASFSSAPPRAETEARLIALARHLRRPRGAKTPFLGTGPYAEGVTRGKLASDIATVTKALESYETRAEQDLAALLREELREVCERYEKLGRRRGRLDFQDLLLLTRDLLRDDPETRHHLQVRFQHLLVDEFQDTDPLQAEILLLLASEDPGQSNFRRVRPKPGKLTVVGDPKQSIYGFRRADLDLYERLSSSLVSQGVRRVTLDVSRRALRPLQALVNETFEPLFMKGGGESYVPLSGGPPGLDHQPAVVALPAPRPLGDYGTVYEKRVRSCLPDAVAAFVSWLVKASGWEVRDRQGHLRALRAEDVCLLFRNLRGFRGRLHSAPFQRALQEFGLDNVLVGARSLYERDEIEALITALSALEWPSDELMVYGALRGPFFAFPDEALFRWRERHGKLHPYRAPRAPSTRPLDPSDRAPRAPSDRPLDPSDRLLDPLDGAITEALELLRALSRHRNRRPYRQTVQDLLHATRALTGFGLRPDGTQVLINVDRVLDLALAFEGGPGISFRGFLNHLREEADRPRSSEGVVSEEGAPGVRLMSVHKAKGLEFPVVVLADPTTKVSARVDRYVDPEAQLAAVRLAGLTPLPLHTHQAEAQRLEAEESHRLAYVAATRARDLLVIPTVGRDVHRLVHRGSSWMAPLLAAIHPAPDREREARNCPGAPPFGEHSMVMDGQYPGRTVRPGLHDAHQGDFQVAWWDPNVLPPRPSVRYGLAHERFLAEGPRAEASKATYAGWAKARSDAIEIGIEQSCVLLEPASAPPDGFRFPVAERSLKTATTKLSGRRYGSLVHRSLRDLDIRQPSIPDLPALVELHGRTLKAHEAELEGAVRALEALLEDDLIRRARRADLCLQSCPLVDLGPDGSVLDTTIDLLFREPGGWVAVDIVSGSDTETLRARFEHVLAALERARPPVLAGVILRV